METALLVQANTLNSRRLLKTLFFLSIAVLVVSLFRIETIYLSRHLIQFSLAWAVGGIVHLKLRKALCDSLPFRRINIILALLCALTALISALLAIRLGVWWGIGPG